MRAALGACLLLTSCSDQPGPPAAAVETPRIEQFWADPGRIVQGGSSRLCYGVQETATVRIVPEVEKIVPSLARCVDVTPAQTTTYTLFAANAKGEEATAVTTIAVGPRAPGRKAMIQFMMASATVVKPGQPFTLCYGLKGAAKASLSHGIGDVELSERTCRTVSLQESAKLKLTAATAEGDTDSETLAIEVR